LHHGSMYMATWHACRQTQTYVTTGTCLPACLHARTHAPRTVIWGGKDA